MDQFVFFMITNFSFISRLSALDYICTQGDLALIDFIKEIPCEPRVEVVLIDDAFVERKSMECLFQPNAYLGDEVIHVQFFKFSDLVMCKFFTHPGIFNHNLHTCRL
jgi:hypothetical protein